MDHQLFGTELNKLEAHSKLCLILHLLSSPVVAVLLVQQRFLCLLSNSIKPVQAINSTDNIIQNIA